MVFLLFSTISTPPPTEKGVTGASATEAAVALYLSPDRMPPGREKSGPYPLNLTLMQSLKQPLSPALAAAAAWSPMSERIAAATRGRGAAGNNRLGGSGRERRERNGGATFAALFLSCANQATPSARFSNARCDFIQIIGSQVVR